MQEYKTYIFQKTKKKTRKRLLYNLSILAAIGGIIYMLLIGILGVGIGITGAVFLIGVLLQMKKYDDKYMGITAYGERKEKLVISEEYFLIDDTKISFSELNDLVIYVDEYEGMPREVFGIHHGGNNEITFTYKGKKFIFNYIIKNKSDFQRVGELVGGIEKQHKAKK